MNVVIRDFQPFNTWTVDSNGMTYDSGDPRYITDNSTGRKYYNESKNTIRIKCALLTLGTPIVHTAASIVNFVYRLFKLISFSHFWVKKQGVNKYSFKDRLTDAGIDLLRVIATPLSAVGLELAAIYGLFRPHDGRKLYATIERATYGKHVLAPCFQPNPNYHAFGGDTNKRNAY